MAQDNIRKSSNASAAHAGREPPLIEQISNQLSREILAGQYGPGDRIREPQVAARLGVSRAPIREALRSLERDGLVELTAWRGARVIDPPLSEILAIFDVLGAVFGVVVRHAVVNASAEDLAHWCRHIDRMEKMIEQPDMLALIDAAYRAGTLSGHICGSETAGGMLYRVGKTAYWLHRFLLPAPVPWREQMLKRYRALQEALLARDADRAERAAVQVVRHSRRWIEKHHPEAAQPDD